MKIVIDLDDTQLYGLSPGYVYKKLTDEHNKEIREKHSNGFWGMGSACDKTKISPSTLSAMLNGERKILAEEYFLICKVLNLDFAFFYTDIDTDKAS